MALLWHKKINGTEYEVRSAGNTRRLFTNGVFHSQYNAKHPVTGAIWDLLLLPAFFHSDRPINKVLVLGVGGGAVIKQLQHFLNPEQIDAVDLNKTHLSIAKRFFNVKQKNVKLYQAEAQHWLEKKCHQKYDYIIDDIFAEQENEAVRPIAANLYWFKALLARLNPGGSIVINFGTPQELKSSAYFKNSALSKLFKSAYKLESPHYENAIGAFLTHHNKVSTLRHNLSKYPALNTENKTCKLKFSIKPLTKR